MSETTEALSLEQFQTLVGFENSERFELQVSQAILDLANSLEANFLDKETKIYVIHPKLVIKRLTSFKCGTTMLR